MSELIRQGEMLLVPTPGVPFANSEKVRRAVVGHSESGHNHVLECDEEFDLIVAGDQV